MLLHNQKAAAVSWEEYSWEPYGACEVPDELVPLIKSTGFPVDVTAVPPREKARRVAEAATEGEHEAQVKKLTEQLAAAEAQAAEAKAAAEATATRLSDSRKETEEAHRRIDVLTEEGRTLRADIEGHSKALTDATKEIAALKEQLALEQAQAKALTEGSKPQKPKG